MLCDSIKVKDPMKVGRFGLGFKSVFHVTGEITIFFIFFQACERAESSKSCNLIGSESGRYFTILPANPGGIVGSFIHKFVCCLYEQKPSFSNHFSFKTCAIISISWGKVNFIIQTKSLKGESSKSARKTTKVQQNRWLVMSLR